MSGLNFLSSIPFCIEYIDEISKDYSKKDIEKVYIEMVRYELKLSYDETKDSIDERDVIDEYIKKTNCDEKAVNNINEKINLLYEYVDKIQYDYIVVDDKTFIKNIKKIENLPKIGASKKRIPEEVKNILSEMRDACKTLENRVLITSKAINYFFTERKDEVDNDKLYVEILKDIYKEVSNKKIEKNILEISDLQKYALDLLYEKNENGNREFSELAKKLQNKFKQVFVDEYQDTSLTQEAIIKAITNNYKNKNVFLVGDVKQSIYAFRNSKPKLFIEKSKEYIENKNDDNVLIELNTNYRSNENILHFVNNIFTKTMVKNFGGIDYEKTGILLCGKNENDKNNRFKNFNHNIEINVLKHGKKDENDENPIKFDNEDEAKFIINRIKKLKSEGYKYSDIVILHRSPIRIVDIYAKEFKNAQIPLLCEQKSGFYISYEIRLIIDILTIVDNPMNDIALSSVITSKIYSVTNNELLFLKFLYKKCKIFENVSFFSLYEMIASVDKENNILIFDEEIKFKNDTYEKNKISSDLDFDMMINCFLDDKNNNNDNNVDFKKLYDIDIEKIKQKIKKFLNDIKYFREIAKYKRVSEIINIIYNKTLIYNFFGSMRNGNVKISNLDMLIKVAKSYENSSYTGLYNFIKHIEKIKERKEDDGEAKALLENEDVVRLMTIHKSKGLQFPVVIMPNIDKKYNDTKKNTKILFSEKYGVSLNRINYRRRYETSSIKREVVLNEKRNEELEEEMRLLYVATTRATDKLIFSFRVKTTSKRSFDDVNSLYLNVLMSKKYPINKIKKIKSYAGFIAAGLGNKFLENEKLKQIIDVNIIEEKIPEVIVDEDIYDIKFLQEKINVDLDTNKKINDYLINLDKNINTQYENIALTKMKPKYSVSEIKKIENIKKIYENKKNFSEDIDIVNELMQEEDRKDGTNIGNIYHKFMEKFDFSENFNTEQIDKNKIKKLLNSQLGKNLKNAYLKKNLYREKRFMKLFDYKTIVEYKIKINGETDNLLKELEIAKNINKKIVVQGVVDAFYIYEENGEKCIDIVDYKTDGLTNNKITEEKLINLYKVQIDIYEKAIRDISGIKIKNKYIYSFALDKEIVIKS